MVGVLEEMDTLRRELDRLFTNVAAPPWQRVAFPPRRGARPYPLVNLREDGDHLYLEALMPGVDPATLDVQLVRDTVTVRGEKPRWPAGVATPQDEAYHRSERAAGTFVRTITLPADVDDKGIAATYEHGVLRVTLPKTESAKPRRIAVTAAG